MTSRRVNARHRELWIVASAVAAAWIPSGVILAQEEAAPLDVRLGLSGRVVTASFNVTSAFTESFRRRLGNGFTSRVLIEMELFDSTGASVAATVRACQLRFDTWDDVFHVGVTDEQRTRRGIHVLADDALRACGAIEGAAIAERPLLARANGYRLAVRVALNPVSPEMLERTREFMANPRGTGTGGRPRAFFGAVAKLFRTDSSAGGERFIFQSQALQRP